MSLETIILQTRKFGKIKAESIFEKGKFLEVSEEYFDNIVVKYRNQYELKYKKYYQEFTDKETGLRVRRYFK